MRTSPTGPEWPSRSPHRPAHPARSLQTQGFRQNPAFGMELDAPMHIAMRSTAHQLFILSRSGIASTIPPSIRAPMSASKRAKTGDGGGAASSTPAGPAAPAHAPGPNLASGLGGQAGGHLASFLSMDDGAALSLVSRSMHAAVQAVRGPAAPTGRALVGDMAMHTFNREGEDRFYHPTSLTGVQAPFPHITRRASPAHVPHVTDVRPAAHDAMPDGLSAGVYPTRHRHDIGEDGRLSAPILPTKNADRRTATLTPFTGAPANTYVMPRYKARAEQLAAAPLPPIAAAASSSGAGAGPLPPVAAAARPEPLPALATPVRLTASQRGDAPPGPSLTGLQVRFQSKA